VVDARLRCVRHRAGGKTCCGYCTPDADEPVHTLHVYMNLEQIPVLVLTPDLGC
jgi:hypothetical protein